jgi:hypothetical protein
MQFESPDLTQEVFPVPERSNQLLGVRSLSVFRRCPDLFPRQIASNGDPGNNEDVVIRLSCDASHQRLELQRHQVSVEQRNEELSVTFRRF